MPGDAWRILWPDDDGSDGGEPILSAQMTVPQFFEHWFEPVILIGERDAAQSTRLLWRDTLKYWREKTGNPRLAECDGNDRLLARFCEQMRAATYRRGTPPIVARLTPIAAKPCAVRPCTTNIRRFPSGIASPPKFALSTNAYYNSPPNRAKFSESAGSHQTTHY